MPGFASAHRASASQTAYSILAVSSERSFLRAVGRFLRMFGYEVATAATEDAAALCLRWRPPDVLLVDGASSFPWQSVVRLVQRTSPYEPPYVFLAAAPQGDSSRSEILGAGVDDVLHHPLIYGELLARLRTAARWLAYAARFREQHTSPGPRLWPRRGRLVQWMQRESLSDDDNRWAMAHLAIDHFDLIALRFGAATAEALEEAWLDRLEAFEPPPRKWGRGPDQTCVAVWEAPADEAARAWAESLRESLEHRPFLIDSVEIPVTVSVGVATVSEKDFEPAVLWQRAASSLEDARASGGSCTILSGDLAEERAAWESLATEGRLFEATRAEDVMLPLGWLPSTDQLPLRVGRELCRRAYPAVPVVDSRGQLAGLLRRSDCDEERLASQPWSSLLQPASVVLDRHTSLDDVMDRLAESDEDLVVVVESDRPIGWISRDYLRALGEPVARARSETGSAGAPPDAPAALAAPDPSVRAADHVG